MGTWIAANASIAFLLILFNAIFVEEQNKAIMLTIIGVYSTAIVVFKCIFGVIYHIRCMFLDLFCMREINYDASEKEKMEYKLKNKTVIGNRSLKVPTNTILPPDLMDDIYDEIKLEVGAKSTRNFQHRFD